MEKILEPLLHDLVTLEEHGVFIPKLGTLSVEQCIV